MLDLKAPWSPERIALRAARCFVKQDFSCCHNRSIDADVAELRKSSLSSVGVR